MERWRGLDKSILVTTQKMVTGGKKIVYPECVSNHYTYRDSVDANNRDRMYPIALEEVWKTTRWSCRVFQFLLAVMEVNCCRAWHRILFKDDMPHQDFRKKLAQELINNPYFTVAEMPDVERRSQRVGSLHELVSIPPGKNFNKSSQLHDCKMAYIQKHCILCSKQTRTYCRCTPGRMLCMSCFTIHLTNEVLVH